MLAPNSGAYEYLATIGGVPAITLWDGRKIERPHRSWLKWQLRWRFLLDSWEGGEVYRMAVYGVDTRGLPVRNMIRHKREYPTLQDSSWSLQAGRPAGTDPANQAYDDDYELRRARTPVPTFLADVVKRHLGKIYTREIDREGPDELTEWWRDVAGDETPIDRWMAISVAPLLMVLGQLDILIEPPPVPEGKVLRSRADELSLGLDQPIASYILPQNVPWWRLDRRHEYIEVIIREVQDDDTIHYRYWNAEAWTLYDAAGKHKEGPVEHGYGRVPILRLFDRQRPSARDVGLPRYEAIAEIQREFYNRDSELILSDTTQAHPLLQAPEDFIQPDGTLPVGPNWLLPKKKNTSGGDATYEGFDVVEFPKEGADSIRLNKADLVDAADRASLLLKPAGAQGTDGRTVAQSGIAKRLDAHEACDLLAELAEVLARAERRIAELYLVIRGRGEVEPSILDAINITYPRTFNLLSSDELLEGVAQFLAVRELCGACPETDQELLCRSVRLLLPGLADEEYETFDLEIEAFLERQAGELAQAREGTLQLEGPARSAPPGEDDPYNTAGSGADDSLPLEQSTALATKTSDVH